MTGHGRRSLALAGVMVAAMGVGVSPGAAADTPGDPSGGAAAAPVRYTTVDVGTLGGDLSSVGGFNERGQLAGSAAITPKRAGQHAFLWDPATGMRDLGSLGGSESFGEALNERGQVAGWVQSWGGSSFTFLWDPATGMRNLGTVGGRSTHPVAVNGRGQAALVTYNPYFWQPDDAYRSMVWDPVTGMHDVGTLGGEQTKAVALNERGQVAGWTTTKAGQSRAFLWDPATGMRDLGALGKDSSSGGALNERGQVAGAAWSTVGDAWVVHAFLWDPTTGMRDLGSIGDGRVTALNERGQVVGTAGPRGTEHAFLWDPTAGMRDLGTLGGDSSRATDVNERGQVVGWALTKSGQSRAFLWDPTTGMRDLGTLGGAESYARVVNDRGQVAGTAQTTSGHDRAVLWTPSSLAPRVSVTAARAGYGNQLHVNVNPNRYQASDYWTFRVHKRTASGSWTTLSGTYRTQGTAETRTLTLGAGVFRVTVAPRYGYTGATSTVVRLTRPTVRVTVRAVDSASRLFVDVDPNKGTGSWSFRVQKRTPSGSWTTLATSYTTLGVTETRTINLRAGTYRVRVNAKYGYLGATSAVVSLAR